MNKYKEALQKIVALKPNNQSTINESLTEWANNILNIATEALQSESEEQPTSPSIEKEIEVTGQEQSSEVVKELNWLHNKLWELGWNGFTDIESERGALAFHNAYKQLKANNSLEELEKWVKEEIKDFLSSPCKEDKNTGAYIEACILNKIQELKTKQ